MLAGVERILDFDTVHKFVRVVVGLGWAICKFVGVLCVGALREEHRVEILDRRVGGEIAVAAVSLLLQRLDHIKKISYDTRRITGDEVNATMK